MLKKWNSSKWQLSVGVVMIIGLGSYPVAAQSILTTTEETILTASDSTALDEFGGAVAMNGNTAIVGAPIQTIGGETNQGAVYVYVRDGGGTWTEQDKLLGSGSDALDHFGTSVDIEGDTAIVGGGIGNVAYIFVRTGTSWSEEAQLTAPTVGSVDQFGISVAISGETALVGSLRGDTFGGNLGPGVVYVFVRNGTSWSLQETLFPDDGEDNDEFGRSVDIEGDLVVVGASAHDPDGKQNAGAAYVFKRTGTTWSQENKLGVAEITAFDQFGWAAALNGETALIGARSGNGAINQAGVAYVFRRNGTAWAFEDKLFPQNEDPLDVGGSRFGHSVALLGNRALIGAPRTDVDSFNGTGAAYVFERIGTTWNQRKKLTASNSATFGGFGGGVALIQDSAFIGASEQFSNFPSLNSAYPFSLTTSLSPGADLDGNSMADLVWRNTSTGEVAVWLMNGLSVTSTGLLGSVPLFWEIMDVGDLDGNGTADLVWRNTSTGDVAAWLMNGLNVASTGIIAGAVPLDFEIAGVGDLDGNGTADLVWRNTSTGEVAVWLMNGLTVTSTGVLGGVPLVLEIMEVCDLDGNGTDDLVWRNTSTGDVAAWLMNGLNVASTGVIAGAVPLAFEIAGVGDLDGNGTADLVWRNTSTGEVVAWLMDGLSILTTGSLATVPLAFTIADVGDLDGNRTADLVWRNTSTGDLAAWLMNGLVVSGSGVIAGAVSLDFEIQ